MEDSWRNDARWEERFTWRFACKSQSGGVRREFARAALKEPDGPANCPQDPSPQESYRCSHPLGRLRFGSGLR